MQSYLEGKSKHGRHTLLRENWCRNENFSLELPRTVHDIWVFTQSWSGPYKLYGVSFTVHIQFFGFLLIRADFGGSLSYEVLHVAKLKKTFKVPKFVFSEKVSTTSNETDCPILSFRCSFLGFVKRPHWSHHMWEEYLLLLHSASAAFVPKVFGYLICEIVFFLLQGDRWKYEVWSDW